MEISEAATTLAEVRDVRALELSAAAALLDLAARWADLHPVDDPALAAVAAVGGDLVPLAGVGVPLMAASCVPELAAAVGLSTESGQLLIGDALELRHRLPLLWSLMHAGRVPAWRARQVARATRALTVEAAAYVDRQVAAVAGRVGPVQLERLVTAAVLEFMPAEAERQRLAAGDGRRVDIRPAAGGSGLGHVDATLDLVDALDLDHALSRGAHALAGAGCTESSDVRRAMALGELARRQPALDLMSAGTGSPVEPSDPASGAVLDGPILPTGPAGPRLTLYLHLSADALSRTVSTSPDAAQVGWVGNTRTPVTAGQIREWCGRPDARVSVRPVIDLNEPVAVDGYAISDRLREQVVLRDPECVFPFCHRPAHPITGSSRAGSSVDLDHTIAWEAGGSTSTANLAPLCRRHHNAKTHHRWRYLALEPGRYLWTSPHGLRFLRDRHGTTGLGPPLLREGSWVGLTERPRARALVDAASTGDPRARPAQPARGLTIPSARPTPRGGAHSRRTRVPTSAGTGDDEPPPF